MTSSNLTRSLGLRDATALVVGTIIGTGVFLKTAVMAQQVGAPLWIMVAWGISGLLSLAGALAYAELGSRFPRAGGEYVFLHEAYGELPAFLYGWQRFWIGSPGSIAAYGVGTATFLGGLVPLGAGFERTAVAIGCIGLFSGLNCLQVSFGGKVQSFLTVLKVGMVIGLSVAIFGVSSGSIGNLATPEGSAFPGFSALGAAMLAALWAFDGWNNMPMAAGEIKNPGRNIPLALGAGTVAVLAIYGAANLAYCYALPFSEVVSSSSSAYPDAPPVATKAAATAFGAAGVTFLSVAFVISAVGAMNGSILTNARVPYAMARDGLFFRRLGSVHSTTHVPIFAVVVQGVWAAVLAMLGTFDQLTNYVVFASWIFYALAIGSLGRLRRRAGVSDAVFRTPGYPWLPAAFIVVSVLLLINTVYTSPRESLFGLAFILAGVPAYFLFKRRD